MNETKKVLVYPYNRRFTPVLRHAGLLGYGRVTGLASPAGWGLGQKDACAADGGPETGLTVARDFDAMLDECDTVLFADTDFQVDFKTFYLPPIIRSMEKKKSVILFAEPGEEDIRTIRDTASFHETDALFHGSFRSQEQLYESIGTDERLLQIRTPIVFVLGTGTNMSKFEIQLALRERFMQSGYKVSQIGTRSYCEALGFHSYPAEMFECAIPDYRKVILFNRFVKRIETGEKPDVIVIGIPGGVMAYDRKFHNRFGFMAYTVANAVEPDAAVFSTNYEDWNPDYFTRLSETLKSRLGFYIDCFNLSVTRVDLERTKAENRLVHTVLDYRFIDEKKQKYAESPVPILNIANGVDCGKMAECIIDRLASFARVPVF